MPSMWQQQSAVATLIVLKLLLLLLCMVTTLTTAAPTTPLPTAATLLDSHTAGRNAQQALKARNEKQDIDCKLTFNVVRSAATGQAQLVAPPDLLPTMGSLGQQLLALHDNTPASREQRCTLQLLWQNATADNAVPTAATPVATATAIAATATPVAAVDVDNDKIHNPNKPTGGTLHIGNSQPVYELQLVVWPTDDEQPAAAAAAAAVTEVAATATRTTKAPTILPLYEDQLVVFPQMDFQEENLDYFFDDLPGITTPAAAAAAASTIATVTATTTTTTPATSSSPATTPTTVKPITTAGQVVHVLEDYHVVHPNGTAEYKLILSNGQVNYKKIYAKRLENVLINVQEGYDSVPIPGQDHQYHTQYYIADEHGYNVYKIEHNYEAPVLPNYLHYKASNVATKASRKRP